MKSGSKLDDVDSSISVKVHIAICHEYIQDKDAIGRDILGMKVLTCLGFKVTVGKFD